MERKRNTKRKIYIEIKRETRTDREGYRRTDIDREKHIEKMSRDRETSKEIEIMIEKRK